MKPWTHPGTGERRVYVNGLGQVSPDAKVWLTAPVDGAVDYTVRNRGFEPRMSFRQRDLEEAIEQMVFDLLGEYGDFDAIWNAVNA